MKIVHVTSVHPPFDRRIFFKQAVSLSKSGYEVHLIAASNKHQSGLFKDVNIHIVKKNENRISRVFINGYRVLSKSYSIDGAVFHFHDPELIPWFLILKLLGRKVVMDVHENYPAQILGKKWMYITLRKALSHTVQLLEYIAAKLFDGIVTVDSSLTSRFRKYSTTIPIATAHNFPVIDKNILADRISIDKYKANVILSLGGANQARCAEEFIKSLEYIKNNNYRVFFGGNDNNNEMLDLLSTLKPWNNVDFIGSVPIEEISSLLIKSSLSINLLANLPNHQGNRSNRLFEAMAAGLPVIVSDFGDVADFVNELQCGISVDHTSSVKISEGIIKLLSNPEYAMKLGLNGRDAVLQQFTWDREFNKIVGLYDTILT